MIDAPADFFVAREQQPHGAVSNLDLLKQALGQLHNHGNAGFVVAAQQRRAVGGHQRATPQPIQFRIVGDADHP